jgi:serine/threonine-protein kinase
MDSAQVSDALAAVEAAVAGRYALGRELGRGGMGVVVLAQDLALDRPVAIKILPASRAIDPTFRARFLREARLAARLAHPHVVPIHAVEDHGAVVFFVMGYVDGETLAARLARVGALPPREVTRVVQEVAWALAYAHGRGVVHRDIKPENILLETGSGRAVVADFGIARADGAAPSATLTQDGVALGTAAYMSPEQAAGEKVDGRSDLYALGVVAFQALTGRLPFVASTAAAVLAMQLTRPSPPVASLRPGLPAALAAAVDRSLAKSPAARFASGEAMAEAFGAAGETTLPIAPPIRAFLRVADHVTSSHLFILVLLGVAAAAGSGPRDVLAVLAVLAVVIVVRAVTDLAVRARRLLRAGYRFVDVREASAAEQREREEQRRGALAATRAPHDRAGRRRARAVAALGIALAVAAGAVRWAVRVQDAAAGVATAIALVAGLAAAGVAGLWLYFGTRRFERGEAGFSAPLWRSEAGRALFWLAGIGRTPAAACAPTGALDALVDAAAAAAPRDQRAALRRLRVVLAGAPSALAAARAREGQADALLQELRGSESVSSAALPPALAAARREDDARLCAARDAAAAEAARWSAVLDLARLRLRLVQDGLAAVDEVVPGLLALLEPAGGASQADHSAGRPAAERHAAGDAIRDAVRGAVPSRDARARPSGLTGRRTP